jgi:hypothetical protein
MIRHYAIATVALTASIAAPAAAGLLTMTVNSANGADDWSSYSNYKMVLTIDSDDLDKSGSAGTFTLNSWKFEAFNQNDLCFVASGNAFIATFDPPSDPSDPDVVQKALVALQAGTITDPTLAGGETPTWFMQFSYEFVGNNMTLAQAINASAGRPAGELTLSATYTTSTPMTSGELFGTYTVPAPSAIALLGVGGLMVRRRRD